MELGKSSLAKKDLAGVVSVQQFHTQLTCLLSSKLVGIKCSGRLNVAVDWIADFSQSARAADRSFLCSYAVVHAFGSAEFQNIPRPAEMFGTTTSEWP